MYKPRHKRPEDPDFDLIVIGSGAGGEVAAYKAAKAGKKVAIVESYIIGGECPNYGCVPTKSLLQAAEVYEATLTSAKFGIKATASVDYPALKAWKDLAVRRTGTAEGEIIYRREGIRYIHGRGHFLDPWTISVSGKRYSGAKFLIATGTHSMIPPITGLEEAGYITYEAAINLTKPLRSVFVIGGGAIGCEFAQLFSIFGAKVHIADIAPHLLPLEDPEAGDLLSKMFSTRGIQVLTSTKVVRVSKKAGKKIISYETDGHTHQVSVDEVLVASGMSPNTDMGLENAHVKYDRKGITVNRYMQTSAKHIYAAGDVVGPYRFTHTAAYQSRLCANNMYSRNKVAADYRAISRCVFVEPEIACVGPTELQLQEKGVQYQTASVPISIIGRANTSDVTEGFVKVIADRKGVLLAAVIASPRAGEMIHELTLAIQHRMKATAITNTVHAFPTWSEAVRLACNKIKSP